MNNKRRNKGKRETMWTQKRKKQHSKDDTGQRHARTETPEVLALQTSARQGRKQRQPQREMCFAAEAVQCLQLQKAVSHKPTLEFRSKSLAPHQDGLSS